MKNIFKGLLIGAAVVALSSCVDESFVQFDPENAVAPVLNELPSSSYELTEGSDDFTFTWFAADFGVSVGVRYTLYASCEGYADHSVEYVEGIESTSLTVTAAALNNVLISSFECEAYSPYDISFYVVAAMKSTTGVTDATLTSNVISATITPYPAEVTYDCVYVTGSLNGWVFTGPYLYNYANDGVNYQGVIDFTTDYASNEFKITDSPDWNNGNYGASDTTEGGDPDSYQFVDGSNDNVKVYRDHRYYHFTFDKGALVIYKDYGFDAATVNVNGTDYEMTYHLGKQRFYVDVDNASGTVIASLDGTQFTTSELTSSGNQRIYFDFNNLDGVSLFGSASAYDTDEDAGSGGDDENTHVNSTFMLSGEMTDDWANKEMTSLGNEIYVAYEVAATAGQQYGFNDLDNVWWAAWSELAVNGVYTAPIDEAIPCDNWNGPHGSNNITIPEDNTYDFWVMYNQGYHYLVPAGTTPGVTPDTWGVVGTPNNWGSFGDFAMTEDSETGYLVYKGLVLVSGDEIKLRYGNDPNWSQGDYGSSDTFAANTAMALTAGGGNISVTKAGTYDIYFDQSGTAIWIMASGYKPGETPASWGICGTNNSWGGDGDDWALSEEDDGIWVRYGVALEAGYEIKFRYNNSADWSEGDYGSSDTFTVGEAMSLTAGGGNIAVTTTGTYDVYLDLNETVAYFMNEGDVPDFGNVVKTFKLAGEMTSSSWDRVETTDLGNGIYAIYNVEATAGQQYGFDNLDGTWWSACTALYSGTTALDTPVVCHTWDTYSHGSITCDGTTNMAVPSSGTFDFYAYGQQGIHYLVTAGTTPGIVANSYGICGTVTGWGAVGDFAMTEDGSYLVYKGLVLESGDAFKIRYDNSWPDDGNYGTTDGATYSVNTAIDVFSGGTSSNIAVSSTGTFDVYLDKTNLKVYVMDEGKTPADI